MVGGKGGWVGGLLCECRAARQRQAGRSRRGPRPPPRRLPTRVGRCGAWGGAAGAHKCKCARYIWRDGEEEGRHESLEYSVRACVGRSSKGRPAGHLVRQQVARSHSSHSVRPTPGPLCCRPGSPAAAPAAAPPAAAAPRRRQPGPAPLLLLPLLPPLRPRRRPPGGPTNLRG